MEKRLKRIEIVLILMTLLIIGDLSLTLMSNNNSSPNSIEDKIIEQKELPSDLVKKITDKKVYQIKNRFNQQNWDGLYNIFGDYTKAIIAPEKVESEFSKLISATGKIGTYAYSHYEYMGFEDGADWFNVFYICRFNNGRGTIELNFRSIDEQSEITGLNINLEEL